MNKTTSWRYTCVGLAVLLIFCSPISGGWSEGAPFDYFENSWSLIGLKDYPHGTRISPSNKLLIGAAAGTGEDEEGKATVQIRFGEGLSLLNRSHTKTLLDGWLPIVQVHAEDGWVKYDITFWAAPLPSSADWRKSFGWPAEDGNYLNWILLRATNTGAHPVPAIARVEPCEPAVEKEKTVPVLAQAKGFEWQLAPGESAEGAVRISWSALPEGVSFESEDPHLWLDRTIGYWRELLGTAARFEVPCGKAREALYASHVYQLITNDLGEVNGGEGFYDEFYIRDGAYQILQFEEAGLSDAAQTAITSFLSHQREDGRFESQDGQFDANGQALWALWQHYQITGDRAWLETAYPRMRRAAEWIAKARREAATDSAFAGLLPNAPADGEFLWGKKHHIVGYDFWNLRGVLCTAEAARALGKDQEVAELKEEADSYRAAIDAAWKRTGLPHFPPSWEMEGTHWGNTETLWPTEIFPPEDPRVAALIHEVRRNHGGGFAEGTIRWQGGEFLKKPLPEFEAIHPYMSSYTTMASLILGDHEQVVKDFYWYLVHSTAAHSFPEGIYFKRRFAWSNTIPHATGASNYAFLLRHMLIHERGNNLHLLPAIPDWWLEDGREIRIERAPTHFGRTTLTVRGRAEGVEVELDPWQRRLPDRIILHLPRSRPLLNDTGVVVEVRTHEDQKERWDFERAVADYRKTSGG